MIAGIVSIPCVLIMSAGVMYPPKLNELPRGRAVRVRPDDKQVTIAEKDREAQAGKKVQDTRNAERKAKSGEMDHESEAKNKDAPIHYTEAEMPEIVKVFFYLHVSNILVKPKVSEFKIRDIEVKRINDPRMIGWLWKVSGTVAFAEAEKEGQIPTRVALTWTSLVHYTLDGEVDECCRELISIGSGTKLWRRVGRSAWRKEFRDEVRNKWLKEIREYDERYKANTEELRAQRDYIINSRQEILAEGHGVSVEEFQDILKTID